MSKIGTFHKQADGAYAGHIKTLALEISAVTLQPSRKLNDQAPDFRIFDGAMEFGAAWKKTSRENRDYLSVKLDDPSFAFPIHASLVEAEDGYALIWSRARLVD